MKTSVKYFGVAVGL